MLRVEESFTKKTPNEVSFDRYSDDLEWLQVFENKYVAFAAGYFVGGGDEKEILLQETKRQYPDYDVLIKRVSPLLVTAAMAKQDVIYMYRPEETLKRRTGELFHEVGEVL